MEEYTNTSLDPIGDIDGYPVSPCVKSGFCCIKVPCMYGEWNEGKTQCKHLSEPNDIGQRDCGRYQWIKDNVPNYEIYPAFGSGCGAVMFNHLRQKVIKNIKEKGL